jgi:hypothetical protein
VCLKFTATANNGRALQVDPMKPKLKSPELSAETKHLKLKCDILLSTSALNSNLRHYTMR